MIFDVLYADLGVIPFFIKITKMLDNIITLKIITTNL